MPVAFSPGITLNPHQVDVLVPDGNVTFIFWSADSAYLALLRNPNGFNRVEIYHVADLKLVTDNNYQFPSWIFAWSPQGHRFAGFALSGVIIGSPEHGIDHLFQPDSEDGNFDWSPDGKYLAILIQSALASQQPTISFMGDGITPFTVNGPAEKNGAEGSYVASDTGWSADSRYYVYSHLLQVGQAQSADNPRQLVSVDMQTQQSKVLAAALAPAAMEPPTVRTHDGSRLAVPIQKGASTAVLLTNPDGSEQIVLHNEGKYVADMAWSPDGQYIAYVAAMEDDVYGGLSDPEYGATYPPIKQPLPKTLSRLVWARHDGSGEKSLPFRDIHILKWDAGKNLLIYIAGNGNDNHIFALNPATGGSITLSDTLTYNFYRDTYYDSWGRWRFYSGPHKRLVAFTSTVDFYGTEGGAPEHADTQTGSILYLAAWDGSMRKTLETNVEKIGPIVWSADGLRFAYLTESRDLDNTLVVDSYDGTTLWRTNSDEIGYPDLQSLAWTACS